MAEYRLSAQLQGHEDDVRGICVCGDSAIATSSRDRTVKFWTRHPERNHEYVLSKTLIGHSSFVGPLAWIPPSDRFPEGGIVSGGMDTLVLIWDLHKGEVAETLKGHVSQVTGLAVDSDGDIISSSMDCTVRRWRNGKAIEVWEAHKVAVQTVLKLPTGELFTGSSDSTIKLWKGRTCLQTFSGHADTVRCLASMPGLGIVSASHDSTIKVWELTGQPLLDLIGHTSFVYSVDAHSSGQIASGSEDRSLKIWKDGTCVQTIDHPGCIWGVKFLENGDVVTGCSDGTARIWTTDSSRFCGDEETAAYTDLISQYTLSRKTVGGLELMDLPGVEALQVPGDSDGQTLIVREGDNGVAYSWNPTELKWDKKGMLSFDTAEGILKKLSEFNITLSSESEQKQICLSETELSRLAAIVLKDTSFYHTSKLANADMDLVLKILKSWLPQMIFPVSAQCEADVGARSSSGDGALLASQLEGDRRASIEKAYNAALREAEKSHAARGRRRTKPTAHWPKEVIEVFQTIYMETCKTKEVRFKRGEENWRDDPIVHDMALELFARTQRAYTGQQLHNKWKKLKQDKKLDIEGPNLPPPASSPPPQHLGFTAVANGIEIDTGQPPIVFKSQLYTLTGVPPERQKIVGKGGTLEDDDNWSALGVKDGQKLMMIGTNSAITKVLQEEMDTLVIAAANNPSTRELSKLLQLPAIEFLQENDYKNDLEILRKKMEHLDIENNKKDQEIAKLKKQLYTADALRSDMHNELMELKGSIRVFCRVRPILDKSNSEDSAVYFPEKGQFVGRRAYLQTSLGAIKAFTCDRVFPPGVSQKDIFVEISGLVKSAMDGKKVCIFAYGQAGSGKTFTMLGDDGDDAKGLIPRTVEEIFETIQIRESSGLARHTVKIGMSEIYNEEVRNLSSKASNDNVVKTKTQALGALKEALSKRAVAKTSRNERSSRSHFIFTLSIYSYNEKREMCEGVLNIIDLAGSEAPDSDATKEVQAEARAINTSLLYLGTTIGQIESRADFISFRNSQLTKELQNSLEKNCKVLMFVHVAPEKTYAKETAATFEFAAQIKSSIKMDTLDSKRTQLLKEKEFEFKSPGMSVRPQNGVFGDASRLKPPFSIKSRRITKQGPSCTKKFDIAP